MSSDFSFGGAGVGPIKLTESEKDRIFARLYDLGMPITKWEDVPRLIRTNRQIAMEVFRQIARFEREHGSHVVENFSAWSMRVGLPW